MPTACTVFMLWNHPSSHLYRRFTETPPKQLCLFPISFLQTLFWVSNNLVATWLLQGRREGLCSSAQENWQSLNTLFYLNVILCIKALKIKALRKLPVCPHLPSLPLLLIFSPQFLPRSKKNIPHRQSWILSWPNFLPHHPPTFAHWSFFSG